MNTSDNISYTLRIPAELYEELKTVADIEDRSIQKQVIAFIKAGVDAHKKRQKG
jgi:hypothetical protein